MARNVETVRVAAELFRIAIDPGDRAAYLLGHHGQVAAEVLHGREIQDDEVRAGVHKRLRGESVVPGEPTTPSPSVDKHVDRSVGTLRREHIESLDRRRTIGESPRGPQPSARDLAVRRVPSGDLRLVGRVDALVVGVVELLLIQVEPHARPLRAGWLLRGLGRRRACSRSHRAGRAYFEEFPSRNAARILLPAHLSHRRLSRYLPIIWSS